MLHREADRSVHSATKIPSYMPECSDRSIRNMNKSRHFCRPINPRMFRSDGVLSDPLRVHKSDSSTDMMSNIVQLERWRESHVKLGSYF
jgi:hypothetical protein